MTAVFVFLSQNCNKNNDKELRDTDPKITIYDYKVEESLEKN